MHASMQPQRSPWRWRRGPSWSLGGQTSRGPSRSAAYRAYDASRCLQTRTVPSSTPRTSSARRTTPYSTCGATPPGPRRRSSTPWGCPAGGRILSGATHTGLRGRQPRERTGPYCPTNAWSGPAPVPRAGGCQAKRGGRVGGGGGEGQDGGEAGLREAVEHPVPSAPLGSRRREV